MANVDFAILHNRGLRPDEAVMEAAVGGASRLEIMKGLWDHWGVNLVTPESKSTDPAGYPSVVARDAANVALGALLLRYPKASADEVSAFEAATDISQKVHALAMADRVADAIAFHERLDDEQLALRTLSADECREIAATHIDEASGVVRIQDDASTLRYAWGFVFLYQSVAYLDTGDFSQMVAGNSPLLVDRFTGALWVTGTAERPDHYVELYERTGSPNPIDTE